MAVCKVLRPPSASVEFKGEGIELILGLSSSTKRPRESLRRTFSADMSSKKWVSQHLPSKKITSSEEFSASEAEVKEKQEDPKEEPGRQGQFDMWSVIQSNKAIDSNSSAPNPYIHPLVKRSASSLSEKSLEICTESLGSETGSDGFSSSDDLDHSPSQESEQEEEEEEDEEEEIELQEVKKELGAVNYNCSISRKSPARSFPPPLPSLSLRDGPCLHMRPHRKDGRLVLEAVQVPSHNYLHAQRQDGRLLLTFINTPPTEENQDIEEHDNGDINEVVVVEEEEEEEEEEEFLEQVSHLEFIEVEEDETQFDPENAVIDKGIVLKVQVIEDDRGREVMKVHRSALVFNKIVGGKPLKNPNLWDGKSAEEKKVGRALPVLPFNAYECCWKSSSASQEHPHNQRFSSNKPLLLKPLDFLLVKRCKDHPLRPLLISDPRCIATS